MPALVRRLRPKAHVNYRVDDDSDADDNDADDSEADANNDVGAKADDHLMGYAKKSFNFFGLSGEVRNMIYTELLVDPHGVHLCNHLDIHVNDVVVHIAAIGRPHEDKKQLSTNALAACKTFYYEARTIAYGQPFVFYDPATVHPFLMNLRPETISLLRDITILRMRITGVHNNPLLSGLRYAMNLTDFRLGNRVTGSNYHFKISESRIGSEIANKFYNDASYFIRPFVAARGIDALLRVVKFHEGDLRGYPMDQGGTWTPARESTILDAVKIRLLKLMNARAIQTGDWDSEAALAESLRQTLAKSKKLN